MHSTAITLAPMIARPELAHGRYALLRFERGPQTRQHRPWYTAMVTATLASQIRQLAAERHYDRLDADAQRAMRREIADELGTLTQNVVKALKQTARAGRPRVHEERCPICERALTTHGAQEAVERNMAKYVKRRK